MMPKDEDEMIERTSHDRDHSNRLAWVVRWGDSEPLNEIDNEDWFFSQENALREACRLSRDGFNYVLVEAWICLDYNSTTGQWADILPVQDVDDEDLERCA